MLYVSIDVETTGLDPETCQVIEFAAVLADTTGHVYDTFHRYVLHEHYHGEPYALSMHAGIFRILADKGASLQAWGHNIGVEFALWLRQHVEGRVFAAGKNFGAFDLQFLKKMPGFAGLFHHRTLDPTMLYFDPVNDEQLPDLQTCKTRAGILTEVAHTAMEDAMDVVAVLTHKFTGGNPCPSSTTLN